MNYGDPTNSDRDGEDPSASGWSAGRGRADEYGPAIRPVSPPASGRASAGRASVPGPADAGGSRSAGRASVSPSGSTGSASGAKGSASVGGARGAASVGGARGASSVGGARGAASVGGARGAASVGSASVGSASVGGASAGGARGAASVGGPGGAAKGSASVGAAAVGGAAVGAASVGRASVGRATVGGPPGGPGYPGGPPGGPPDMLGGPGRRGVPGHPRRTGNKRRRTNILIAAFSAFIMLLGLAVVGGTYWTDSVALPGQLPQRQSTKIYYSDGKTEMARIGEENRTLVTSAEIPEHVKHAVVAAEDNSFYTNSGIDYKGIARAAWNNVSGGDRQGASTITQQYARNVMNLKEVSYSRKLREAVLAKKMAKEYDKDTILVAYMNTVFFGRNTYGIEAAAGAFFNKHVKDLTVAEGIVLAGVIKDPNGSNGYDPSINEESAKGRFNNYIKPNMVKLGFLSQADADKTQFPTNYVKLDPKNPDPRLQAQWGLDKPTGLVVHHVMDEMSKMTNKDTGKPFTPEEIKNGGFRITTTVNMTAQAAAEGVAGGSAKGSPMTGQPENIQAALVSVEPKTGRVIAYYGGPKGDGNDYAGWYADPVLDNGEPTGVGRHPPGSTFKIYTLGAALQAGMSIDSYWDGTSPKDFPKSGRTKANGNPVTNAATNKCVGGEAHCTLWEATEMSLNVPFYAVTEKLGASTVLNFALQAGVKSMWRPDNGVQKRVDLTAQKTTAVAPKYFSTEVGIGQYAITVLDHANGTATLAARGMAADAHFIMKVEKGKELFFQEKIAPKQIPNFRPEMADDMAWTLSKVVNDYNIELAGSRDSAGKSGTWQYSSDLDKGNAHGWFVGYTASDRANNGLATAVWIGNKKEEQAIKYYKPGSKSLTELSGGGLAGPIWKQFMDAATKPAPKVKFAPPKRVGNDNAGDAKSPEPAPPSQPQQPGPNQPGKPQPTQSPCTIPLLCPTGGGGGRPGG